MNFILIVGYLAFSVIIASLLKHRKGGFYLMLLLSLIFTPLVIGFLGIIFQKKDIDPKTKPVAQPVAQSVSEPLTESSSETVAESSTS